MQVNEIHAYVREERKIVTHDGCIVCTLFQV